MGSVIGTRKSSTSNLGSIANRNRSSSILGNNSNSTVELNTTDQLVPTYYIKSLSKHDTKQEVRCKLVSDLAVRLRTMPVE
jgi:hypothetical protein